MSQFRAGDDDAFRVIHDRYRQRLFAYARQMLSSRQDAEDVLQDVFVRAYAGLRANDRQLALRAWLYRIAHNRCIDELRRARPVLSGEDPEWVGSAGADPIVRAEQRESLRRLIADIHRLPQQQRSALLMREMTGMSYLELSCALSVSVPAVKSLLVRARVGLVAAAAARDTACAEIREELVLAHDQGRRPDAMARRHLRDCSGCREFRHQVRGVGRQLAALVPAIGPAGMLANVLGLGSGAAGGSATAGGTAALASGMLASSAGHVATLLAAAAVTAGGAMEIQHTVIAPAAAHPGRAPTAVRTIAPVSLPAASGVAVLSRTAGEAAAAVTTVPPLPTAALRPPARLRHAPAASAPTTAPSAPAAGTGAGSTSAAVDPSMGPGLLGTDPPASSGTGSATGTGAGGPSGSATDGSAGASSSAGNGPAGGGSGSSPGNGAGVGSTPGGGSAAPSGSAPSAVASVAGAGAGSSASGSSGGGSGGSGSTSASGSSASTSRS